MRTAAACHIHSNWSYDGSWSLQALADEFSRRGYRILLVTEHDRGFTCLRQQEHRDACAQASSRDILVVPGIEYSDAANLVHVLVWGPVAFRGEGLPTSRLLQEVKELNGVAVLAHPARKQAWKSFDPAWTRNLAGIELWNRKTDGWAPSRAASALLESTGVPTFVGMDFHERKHLFPLSMELDLPAAFTEEAVLDCLRSRRFQARAFGCAVTGNLLSRGRFALESAERSRRLLAWCYRRILAARARPCPSQV